MSRYEMINNKLDCIEEKRFIVMLLRWNINIVCAELNETLKQIKELDYNILHSSF